MQTQECLWFQFQPKYCTSSIFIPIYNVLHSSPLVLPCLNGTRMVARQSLGEHKPAVTTWQPNQPCRCSSSTTYRVPILQEFPCAKGKTSFLPFMLQRHNHKAYLDALQKRAGCAPRHLTQNSSEGTAGRDKESWRSLPRMLLGFEMGTLKTNVLSSNDLGYAQQICVPKSLSPKSEYFQHCFWACVLWMQ